jgi:hypothetical protein
MTDAEKKHKWWQRSDHKDDHDHDHDHEHDTEAGDATSPGTGFADPAAEMEAEAEATRAHGDTAPGHTEAPEDDERSHLNDFSDDGYDDRQSDGLPRMPGE